MHDGTVRSDPNPIPEPSPPPGTVTVPPGFNVAAHELRTAEVLAKHGYRITFNRPSTVAGVRTPDVTMNDEQWEFKCPAGAGTNTISHQFSRAAQQASNLVIDLARTGLTFDVALDQIARRFWGQKRIVKLIIIGKNQQLIIIELDGNL